MEIESTSRELCRLYIGICSRVITVSQKYYTESSLCVNFDSRYAHRVLEDCGLYFDSPYKVIVLSQYEFSILLIFLSLYMLSGNHPCYWQICYSAPRHHVTS